MMKQLSKTLMLSMMVALIAACGPVKLPEQKNYKLSQAANVKPSHQKRFGTILVSKIGALGVMDSDDLHYSTKPYEIRSYVNHHWAARPADMLEGLIIKSLQNSHAFQSVVPASFTGDVNYRLKTELVSLHQSFASQPSQVEIVLLAYLIDDKKDKVIKSARLKEVIPAPSNTPYGGVLAANKATSNLLSKLVRFSTN